ncbi:hypothetical protein CAPTEDRAFT_222124 [Capitella teleta]|uniref:Fibronectin type III-like domain-containing protein n=1 Tax=Capitella teleta TaxID=283909 RepID=R7VDU3_CAPTE|nr:hypothetical protein CAPTEDRAFT_222124 [Capitella teleta]|eukprot:ELU13850.1 hypothetical protein CAPTEDRAFT_222124 [Capitella teleta]
MDARILLWWIIPCIAGVKYPFLDPSLPWDVRVDDLVSRLTIEEVIGQTMASLSPPIPRLGIKGFVWGTECLRGVAFTKSTAFPQALGLAATFSSELVHNISEAVAIEARAHWNADRAQGRVVDHEGLSCFSPVINIMRHPLWGRNQETYGEDPFLSGSLAQAFVRGLQGTDPRYVRASAGCKHFDVHGGPENIPSSRFSFDSKVSVRDWRMTFLPQFKMCIEAGTHSLMCSYNSINGVPACANRKLLTTLARQEFGFKGFVVSDDWAIEFINTKHQYVNDSSPEHRELSIRAASMSFVLLKNINVLPLKKKVPKLASLKVFHPSELQFPIASGCDDTVCGTYNKSETLNAVRHSDLVIIALGTGQAVEKEGKDRRDAELPGHQLQLLKDAVTAAEGVPVVLLLFNAGPLNVTWAKSRPDVHAILACFFPAQATGQALFRTLTMADGQSAPAGRLPATWPLDPEQVPSMTNYSMAGHTYRYFDQDRSLYPFGYGLSYSSFQYSHLCFNASSIIGGEAIAVTVQVKNTGNYPSYEVVQVYLSWPNDSLNIPKPEIQLVGFSRPYVGNGQSVKVEFKVKADQMAVWVDDTTGFGFIPGKMTLYVGGQQPRTVTRAPSNVLTKQFSLVRA